MLDPSAVLPDGTPFPFWDDCTTYIRIYHVACEHPGADDANPGTEDRPFLTIGRAAALLQPGEKVIVHRGTYRECVRPAHGGEAPDRMIAYEAAPGERVRVVGSEVWKPRFRPGEGWRLGTLPEGARVWMADLPPKWFVGYNPFVANNMSAEYTTFTRDWSPEEIRRMQLRRGALFADGRRLAQVFRLTELAEQEDAFWVEDPGLRLHVRLAGDADPAAVRFEVTAREQVFAPLARGLGYLRVSGFVFEHAADGVPVPQRAMVSTARGHHWIIERNTIRWANACGVDVGNESWHASERHPDEPVGHHVLRDNHVSDCGICGLAGVGSVDYTLVERNTVERIGHHDIERIWETGGLKFHVCNGVLIRRNVFRHIRNAPGLWLDYLNRNCRVTGNVFADIEGILGGVYLEVSHAPNWIDRNILWDIRGVRPRTGPGANVDTGEQCIVAHNLFGHIRDDYAVKAHLGQSGRVVGGRVGLCRRHHVTNNVFFRCPKRILFSRAEDNHSDGNLFDVRDDATSLCIQYPSPETPVNLEAWREYFGLDRSSRQVSLEAEFNPDTLILRLSIEGALALTPAVPHVPGAARELTPGPFPLQVGNNQWTIEAGATSPSE